MRVFHLWNKRLPSCCYCCSCALCGSQAHGRDFACVPSKEHGCHVSPGKRADGSKQQAAAVAAGSREPRMRIEALEFHYLCRDVYVAGMAPLEGRRGQAAMSHPAFGLLFATAVDATREPVQTRIPKTPSAVWRALDRCELGEGEKSHLLGCGLAARLAMMCRIPPSQASVFRVLTALGSSNIIPYA